MTQKKMKGLQDLPCDAEGYVRLVGIRFWAVMPTALCYGSWYKIFLVCRQVPLFCVGSDVDG